MGLIPYCLTRKPRKMTPQFLAQSQRARYQRVPLEISEYDLMQSKLPIKIEPLSKHFQNLKELFVFTQSLKN